MEVGRHSKVVIKGIIDCVFLFGVERGKEKLWSERSEKSNTNNNREENRIVAFVGN